jgi:hypothetical protein
VERKRGPDRPTSYATPTDISADTSGRRYWYYGKCVGWVKGKRTYWEARLFHHDKTFVFDGIFNSKDLLAIFSRDFYAIDSYARRLKQIAEMELFAEIEDWDSKRESE